MTHSKPFLQYLDDGGIWSTNVPCSALVVCQHRRETEWPTTDDVTWPVAIRQLGIAAYALVDHHPFLNKLSWHYRVGYTPSSELDRWCRLDRLEDETIALKQRMELVGIPDPLDSFRSVRQAGFSLELGIDIGQFALLLSRESPGRGWLHSGLCWGTEQPIELSDYPAAEPSQGTQDSWVVESCSLIYNHGVCVHYCGAFDDPDACFAFTFATNHLSLTETSFRDIEPAWRASLA